MEYMFYAGLAVASSVSFLLGMVAGYLVCTVKKEMERKYKYPGKITNI